jgi:hypothetical protein
MDGYSEVTMDSLIGLGGRLKHGICVSVVGPQWYQLSCVEAAFKIILCLDLL